MMYGPSVNFQDGFSSFLRAPDKSQNVNEASDVTVLWIVRLQRKSSPTTNILITSCRSV